MQVTLDYGKTGLTVELPDANIVGPLLIKPLAVLSDPVAAVAEKVADPTGCARLSELARGRTSACIAICDITRPVPNHLFLRPMVEALEAGGVTLVDIRPAVAYQRGHLPGAVSIPVDDVEAEVPEALFDRQDDRLVLYCRSGSESTTFARRLSNEGFADVSIVEDGVFGWEVIGRKLEQA